MAGSFGYEAGDKYEVSIASGERVILPTVREAPPATLVLADGFSCREQIAQSTERRGLHLAEALSLAQRYGTGGPPGDHPERYSAEPAPRSSSTLGLAGAGAVALGGIAGRVAARARNR